MAKTAKQTTTKVRDGQMNTVIPLCTITRLDDYAVQTHISKRHIINMAIIDYLDRATDVAGETK